MYFAMELKHNPSGIDDIDAERERREEMLAELVDGSTCHEGAEYEDDEEFDARPGEEFQALLPYYERVEDEAAKVAQRYFHGTFQYGKIHDQKLFEYKHNSHVYRCYVDIYNETDDEINIIEVKATTCSKFAKMGFSNGRRGENHVSYPLFVKDGNFMRFITPDSGMTDKIIAKLESKKNALLNRYSNGGKYPHDVAFQKFVVENALREAGDTRKVNYYLAVLNNEYVYDGARDADGKRLYNNVNGQEVIVFIDMNETAKAYQPYILSEISALEGYIKYPHNVSVKTDVGPWCAWGKNTECVFCNHCFKKLRGVPDSNSSSDYVNSGNTVWGGRYNGKYALVNAGLYSMSDIDRAWLKSENHKIQRDCIDGVIPEYVDREKMKAWFGHLEYPIYHFDFESFPCPLPRFEGETPYRQSVFEFSLHIERTPGVCDKVADNVIFLNRGCDTDERKALAQAILDNFKFNEDDSLDGTMLAQNTSFEIGRLKELALLFPEDSKNRKRLLAITEKTADLIHLLRTDNSDHDKGKIGLYERLGFDESRWGIINYYHPDLSGKYSIKKTLPVLVPSLSYDNMKEHAVGNGVQAYITYLNYDSDPGTTRDMNTKEERREALRKYCQQDTWAMVEILRAVRAKLSAD